MAVAVYSHAKRQIPNDKTNNLIADFVNEILVVEDNLLLAIYCLPVYSLKKEDLLTKINEKEIEIKWPDKYKKDVIYRKVQNKPII